MTERGHTIQTFPPRYTHTARQAEAMATVGDTEDFAAFNHLIRKGMLMFDARQDDSVNGVKVLLRERGDWYFTAAQALRLLQNDRSWEDWFPWVVFRNRHLRHNIEWIDWAVEKYGADYQTFDINALTREWREWHEAEAAKTVIDL